MVYGVRVAVHYVVQLVASISFEENVAVLSDVCTAGSFVLASQENSYIPTVLKLRSTLTEVAHGLCRELDVVVAVIGGFVGGLL